MGLCPHRKTPQASSEGSSEGNPDGAPHPEVTATPPGGLPSWWGISEKTGVCTTETLQSGVQTGLPKQPPAQLKRQPLTRLVGTSGGKELTSEDCCSASRPLTHGTLALARGGCALGPGPAKGKQPGARARGHCLLPWPLRGKGALLPRRLFAGAFLLIIFNPFD